MSALDSLFSCFDDSICSNESQLLEQHGSQVDQPGVKRKWEGEDERHTKGKKLVYNPLQDPDINVTELDPGINVHTIAKDDDCLHEVAVPPNQKFPNLVSSKEPPAKTYKFQLDSFQKKAIMCVENNQSVLLSAHTSAGKTVVAEYAIALALKNKQRVIYTTPIKALSNQKYREMLQEFNDVGIMTGDVTIDPMASCLIMTTEILRSMLFRGSEVTKEVGWVIFDEIHYMRDKTRGVVWEETIILLPDNVRYVFLSATIPNARQFAEWVCHLHQQPCHVVYTEYRPTPLQHYLFPTDGDGMHLVVDEKGKFIRDNFDKAMASIKTQPMELIPQKNDNSNENKKPPPLTSDVIKNVYNVVKVLMNKNLAPLIIFSFKKSSCETFAMNLSKLNFNTEGEQKLVEEVFNNAINILSESEKQLPQITKMLPLLKKGIAFHHSGLLPLMKETVEILFGEGLIKALFATETFAMGLNMPAKTVIFTSMVKFDGQDVRHITSGEYIQMSGRAGRRGLDTNGLVVMMVNEKISPDKVTQIMTGKAAPLFSAFHLTYNMILNLMRQEEINPEYMINKSFLIFQSNARLLELRRTLKTKQKKYTAIHISNEESVASYNSITSELEASHDEVRQHILQSDRLVDFLTRGRFVKLKTEEYEYDWGIVMGYDNSSRNRRGLTIRVLLHVQGDGSSYILPKPDFSKKKGCVAIYPVNYKYIHQLSSLEANIELKSKPKILAKAFLKKLNELKCLFPHGFPLLNPIHDMEIHNPQLENLIIKVQGLEKLLSQSPLFNKDKDVLLRNFHRKEELYKEIKEVLDEIKELQALIQMDELQKRKDVLKKLGYCNEIEVISMKGRVACELSCVDELLISEMIFNGIFNELPVDYCVALLSGFICDEKFTIDDLSYDRNIYRSMKLTEEIASTIGSVALDCKLITSKEDYIANSFQPHLVEIVLAWCRGASFLDICKMTVIYEGSIIRYLKILEEVLRQVCRAATNIGNIDLENRFSEGIRILKRGVVFAGSLYL